MSLIKCTECGKKISENATICPSCGCPVEVIKKKIAKKKQEKVHNEEIKQLAKKEKNNISPKQKKKKILISTFGIITGIIALILVWFFAIKIPVDQAHLKYQTAVLSYNEAIDDYNIEVTKYNVNAKQIITANEELDLLIAGAQDVIDCGETPYEAEKMTILSNTLKDARNNRVKLPNLYETETHIILDENNRYFLAKEIHENTTEIEAFSGYIKDEKEEVTNEINRLVIPDYSNLLATILTETQALENSYTIQHQITDPSEDFVIERLNRLESISNVVAVTEENDPNGHLGKAGGYTSQIYFSSPLLETETIAGDKLIDMGTDAGGSIEVYATIEDAEKRNTYLASYDGTYFDSGAHKVIGTVIVRVSTDLTASNQELLTNEIIAALVKP